MSDSIDEIIRQAIQRGDFDNLPKKGKRLNLDEYFELPEEIRVGYTMLKNSSFVPTEVELLKEIAELEERLKNADAEPAAKIRKDIQDKRLKYNLLLEASRRRQK
jgi:hypothetical protein